MAALAWWGLGWQPARNISVSAELCKRVRFRKSECRRCLEVCPNDAIALNPGPAISDRCSDCGLCQNACPTEVFRDKLHSEQYLLDRVRSLLAARRTANRPKRVSISCHRARPREADSLGVACLGSITENVLVGAALAGCDRIRLMKGNCSQCRLQAGEELLRDSLRRSRALLESLGLGEVPICLEEGQSTRESPVGRNELFSRVAARVRNHVASVRYHHYDDGKAHSSRRAEDGSVSYSPRRAYLRTLASRAGTVSFSIKRNEPAFRWGNLAIDQTRCSACGICVSVCPTGALEQGTENGTRILSFVSSACTKCRLCIESCLETAIDHEQQWSFADLLNEYRRVVARIQMTVCRICGEVMPEGRGPMCPSCEKRQAWRCM